MTPGLIAYVVGGVAVFVLCIAGALRLRRGKLRTYQARFAALGPGEITHLRDGVRCDCIWQGRTWRLAFDVPVVLGRSASLDREDTPRLIVRLEMTRPAPIGLYILIAERFLAPHATRRFDKQRVPIDGAWGYYVGATTDVTTLFTPAFQALVVRAHAIPAVDLELRTEPGKRGLVCTKLYGALELPPLLTVLGEIADAFDAWASERGLVAPAAPAAPASPATDDAQPRGSA